jgi:hypothetical protein
MLFSTNRYLCTATTIDESDGGVGLKSGCGCFGEVGFVLDPEKAVATKVRLAWTAGDKAGFQHLRSANLRGYVSDTEFDHVRIAWARMAHQHGLIAPGGAFTGTR